MLRITDDDLVVFYFLLSSSIVIRDTWQAHIKEKDRHCCFSVAFGLHNVDFLLGSTRSGKMFSSTRTSLPAPKLRIIVNYDIKHACYTKRIARLFVGVVVTAFGRPCTSPRSTTPDERLRPPFRLKLCHNAPLANPLPVGRKKNTLAGNRIRGSTYISGTTFS